MKKFIPLIFLFACSPEPAPVETMSPINEVTYTSACINFEEVYVDETGHILTLTNGNGEVKECGRPVETILERDRVGL